MAPDRTARQHPIIRSGTAHRVLRSELNDYNFKFKVSLLTMLPPSPERRPDARQDSPLTPRGARIDDLVPWNHGGEK
jgi:hypothetical protein